MLLLTDINQQIYKLNLISQGNFEHQQNIQYTTYLVLESISTLSYI